MATQQGGMSRRTKALLWLIGVGIIIAILVAYQLFSILYVLATLSLVILLLIVAFANLETIGGDAFRAREE